MNNQQSLAEQCRDHLERRWKHICGQIEGNTAAKPPEDVSENIRRFIKACLTSATKSYHYVLPTQILAKCVNSSLDSHSLMTAYGKPGAFDARTIAHDVIVPFDKANYNVLGGSPEPYVNNPLRCPAVIAEYRTQQKAKEDWDKLIAVLDFVETAKNPQIIEQVFDLVLTEIHHLLSQVCVLYPTPNRISLNQTFDLISRFLSEKSGGDRMEAVCTALFRVIADTFKLFDQVQRVKVNATDASSGMAGDIECSLNDRVVLLVEVKDRSLTLTQLDAKLDVARYRKISEILFIAKDGIDRAEKEQTERRIIGEFASGQNVYVSDFFEFSRGIFVLLGEKGRGQFLSEVGKELDRTNSPILHRRTWATLLRNI